MGDLLNPLNSQWEIILYYTMNAWDLILDKLESSFFNLRQKLLIYFYSLYKKD